MEKINKIIMKYGEAKTAKKLGITKRYVQYLAKGQYIAGVHLAREIDRIYRRIGD